MTNRDRFRTAILVSSLVLLLWATLVTGAATFALGFLAFMQHDLRHGGGGELFGWLRAVGCSWPITAALALGMNYAWAAAWLSTKRRLQTLRYMLLRRTSIHTSIRLSWSDKP